jgi:hypothetical protein
LDSALATANGVPESPHHDQAAMLDTTATTNFVQSIIDEPAGNDTALSALLDVKGDIVFVIDTAGSMGDEISLVMGILNYFNTGSCSPPDPTFI